MPLFTIKTNTIINDPEKLGLSVSREVSAMLGKPESYVMVSIMPEQTLFFGGSHEPAAFIELKSLGLPETDTADFSNTLCQWINQQLNIDKDRIYIEFSNPQRHMWGWNGTTF